MLKQYFVLKVQQNYLRKCMIWERLIKWNETIEVLNKNLVEYNRQVWKDLMMKKLGWVNRTWNNRYIRRNLDVVDVRDLKVFGW